MGKKLKIAFLLGCLEPGADGVGDYTATLAQELVKQGHNCLLISLKDPFVLEKPVPSLFPLSSLIASIRFRNINQHRSYFEAILHTFRPDFISLQFVPYAFQKKGLPFFLVPLLRPLTKKYPLHIMMHELWTGFDSKAKFLKKYLGCIQKLCIQLIITKLKPFCIHTHTQVYQSLLSEIYPKIQYLPLFSSIQKQSKHTPSQSLEALLYKKSYNLSPQNKDQTWIISLFGTLHPEWPPEPLLPILLQAATRYQKSILILHFGHIGRGEKLWQAMIKRYQSKCTFLKLGPLDVADIRTILEHTQFAVATSPLHLLEKSATALTFLEWGCPLIVNRIEIEVALPLFFETRILKVNTKDFTQQLLHASRYPYKSLLEDACEKFLRDIQAFSS